MSDYYGPNDRTEVHKVGQSHFGQAVMAEQYHQWDKSIQHYEAAIREIRAVSAFMEEQRVIAYARMNEAREKRDE